MYKQELTNLVYIFLESIEKLHNQDKISHENYIEMSSLKIEFLKNIKTNHID